MTTKAELIANLHNELDLAATDMVTAVATFRTAYRAAHAVDLVLLKLGDGERGQDMSRDKLSTINTPAHAEIMQVGALFDGLYESAYCQSAAVSRLAELQTQYPEAFT